jgi:16S rRNA (guanine527-N7)-methyltransferase
LKYGPLDFARDTGVPRETLSRFTVYARLIEEWNDRVNLVAPSTIPDLWRRHFWDSAQLAPLIPPQARTIVDLGSGAGFPGMVLALLLSSPARGGGGSPRGGETEGAGVVVHLIEATQKKCRFLEAVALATGAEVHIHCARAEAVKGLTADVVTARAVAPLTELLRLAFPFFGPSTTGLFLKGRTLNDELTHAVESWKLEATRVVSRSDPSGAILRVTGLTPWRKPRKHS